MTQKLDTKPVEDLADGIRTTSEIAGAIGYSNGTVSRIVKRLGLPRRRIGSHVEGHQANLRFVRDPILKLCDGIRSAKEIARLAGCSVALIHQLIHRFDAPRRRRGGLYGALNPMWRGGIELGKYMLVKAPLSYRGKKNHRGKVLFHRLVMEKKIGRLLRDNEVVHHIDGHPLNNDPDNLMVFDNNANHLSHHRRKAAVAQAEDPQR